MDIKEGDMIDILNNSGNIVYTINVSFGEYKRPLKTTVQGNDFNLLSCTPGVKGGWPYYIADFIHA
jgi:hypothetical protein